MRRRDFVYFITATVCCPLSAPAQIAKRMRIGVFLPGAADDPAFQVRNAAFAQGLSELGWAVGRNVEIEYRWGKGESDRYRKYAAELIARAPDVILALGTATVTALRRETQTIPIIFVNVTDPVGTGLVASLARPGGNATGYLSSEFGFAAKWLELLREVAPQVKRVAVLRDSAISSQVALLGGMQSLAGSLGMELRPVDTSSGDEIERAIAAFGAEPGGGLIAVSGTRVTLNRDLILGLADKYRLPAIYGEPSFVPAGGLIAYAADYVEQFRRAAGYVDRILKGEKPADLPVQAPTKYELSINLRTAKSLGLAVPPSLLARADEVIE